MSRTEMIDDVYLTAVTSSDIQTRTTLRRGETKLGQGIHLIEGASKQKLSSYLASKAASGVRYALLGVPEDIGPRANGGRGGAHKAWDAFLTTFVNIQSNKFLNPTTIVLLGTVEVTDLQHRSIGLEATKEEQLSELRRLCSEVDARVAQILQQIVSAGLKPIIVGGGHNNTYAIQKGIAAAQEEAGKPVGLACINCDPHADFRTIEGRHSGNGFSYAYKDGILKAYYVLGLHESYNSQFILEELEKAGFSYSTYEEIKVYLSTSWSDAINKGVIYLKERAPEAPVGVELDLDSIAFLPVSAETPNGITSEEAAQYIFHIASTCQETAYLHLPEGAPQHHASEETGRRYIGRTICNAVLAYIKGNERKRQSK